MFLVSRFLPAAFAGIFTDNAEYIELSVWGNTRLYHDDHSLSFQYVFVDSLTALGMTSLSLFLSLFRKTTLFCRHLPAAPGLYGSKAPLCGTDCRRNRRPFIICCFYPGVFQISAGNRQACADRNREGKSSCLTCGWYCINSKKKPCGILIAKTLQIPQGFFIPLLFYIRNSNFRPTPHSKAFP